MNIQIFGQNELVKYIEKGGSVYSHCISITNPGRSIHKDDTSHSSPKILNRVFDKVLKLKFWDAQRKDLTPPHHKSKRIPESSDIKKVLKFIEETKDEATGYTIHCWRGISRSTAVGFGILQYFLNDENEASKQLISVRRKAMPLKLIVELFDKEFGSNLAQFNKTVYKARIEAMRKELNL